jgi:hypothetical protein
MNGSWTNQYSAWRIAELKKDVAHAGKGRMAALGIEPRVAEQRRFGQFGRRLFDNRRRPKEGWLAFASWRALWPHRARPESAAGNH